MQKHLHLRKTGNAISPDTPIAILCRGGYCEANDAPYPSRSAKIMPFSQALAIVKHEQTDGVPCWLLNPEILNCKYQDDKATNVRDKVGEYIFDNWAVDERGLNDEEAKYIIEEFAKQLPAIKDSAKYLGKFLHYECYETSQYLCGDTKPMPKVWNGYDTKKEAKVGSLPVK